MSAKTHPYCFAEYSFDRDTGRLTRGGTLVPIEHQPSLVLARLLQTPGELVSRHDLAEAVWGRDTHVDYDDGLNYCIRQLRAALSDDSRRPRFIETLPRRGYRFIAPVGVAASAPVASRRLAVACAAAAIAILTIVVESRPNNHHEVVVAAARSLHDLIF